MSAPVNRAATVSGIVRTARAETYVYGSNDCFFLGLKVIDALNGTSHVKTYSGAYRTLKGAQRALRKRGHTSIVTLYAGLLPQIPWGRARIGDLAVVDVDGVEHVGVHGGQAWMSITESGPVTWPLHMAKAAFKV
ncbi:DUF6950 family protein [Hoeflea sp.]|uniref:DUF6950 family protein n=1 Tax=Hoeflea sp. TaxID=1940281 RepID=UPI003B52C2E3